MGIIKTSTFVWAGGLETEKADFHGLNEVETRINDILMKSEGVIKDMCISLLNSGGKRLRPLMVIYSGLCFSSLSHEMINTAVAAELIHMASLVHDDIIDKSDSRRGKRTINSVFGNHAAVLAGDFLFAEAFSILSSFKLLKSLEFMVEAIQKMCYGEVREADDSFNTDVTINDYFDRIEKKTGILISASCRAGAAAANASEAEINIMNEYGLNVGYAFQIMDDILDFTGDERKLGKPVGMDLMNGNITLPVILLMDNEYYSPKIRSILKAGHITRNEFNYINEAIAKTGVLKKSYSMAEKCISKAKSSIYSIPGSIYRSWLIETADKVINRES